MHLQKKKKEVEEEEEKEEEAANWRHCWEICPTFSHLFLSRIYISSKNMMYGQTQILILCFVPRLISAKCLMFFDSPVTAGNIKQKGAGKQKKKNVSNFSKLPLNKHSHRRELFFFFFFYKPPPQEGCDLFPPRSVFFCKAARLEVNNGKLGVQNNRRWL